MGAENWDDPHDLIPEQFRREFGDSETVADALRRAACRPTTTPLSEQPRCPECHSRQVTPKASKMQTLDFEKEGDYRCEADGCHAQIDEPIYTTKIMNKSRTQSFDWIESDDELADADSRTPLEPPLAGIDRETAVEVALRLREPWRDTEGPSYTEIARYLDFGDSWVGHRVREWRDGEHRDLVPDPTDEPEPEPEPRKEPPIDPAAAVARIGGDYGELVAARAASSDATAVATDGGRRRWEAYGSD